MNNLLKFTVIVIIIWGASCSKKNDPTSNLIDPKDADKLMEVIITPNGGITKQGEPPMPSTDKGKIELKINPDINIENTQLSPNVQKVNAYQKSKIYIASRYECDATEWFPATFSDPNPINTECKLRLYYLKTYGTPYCIFRIKGSSNYKIFEYSKPFGNSGNLSFPIELPENIGDGEFEAEFSIVDEFGLVSNYTTTKVNITRVDPKDNPALAFGCDLTKAANELLSYSNAFSANPTYTSCENLKVKYNELATAISNCKDIPASSKADIAKANKDLQSIDCSIFK